MTSYFHGWLWIEENDTGSRELFNHARTAAYLASSPALGCGTVSNVLDDGGCAAYAWGPPAILTDDDDVVLYDDEGNVLTTGWNEAVYTDPVTDNAPWYNPAFPESGEALGFWVTDWTGLDSGHVQREVSQRGNYGGGGVFSATGSRSREMGFEVVLLGESEAALDYLYRWLDATIMSVCATCATDTILIRRVCPSADPLTAETASDGVVELRQVGMISALQWGAPPVEQAGCFIRRVNFTMGAMDPCMYGFCTDVDVTQNMNWASCFAAAALSPGRANCRPTCSEMDGLCRLTFDYDVSDPSAVAPIVTVAAPVTAGSFSFPMRIRTYANPNGLLPSEICGAPLLGELYVSNLPPWSELKYDVAGRQVQYRDAGSGDWIDGFGFIGPNTVGVPRFFALGCGSFTTVVEPADFCLDAPPSSALQYPSVDLALQPRMGCA